MYMTKLMGIIFQSSDSKNKHGLEHAVSGPRYPVLDVLFCVGVLRQSR